MIRWCALTPEERKSIAAQFQRDRIASGYIQRDLGERVGVHSTTISEWELGKTVIPILRAFRLHEKTYGMFPIEKMRPDFIREFSKEIEMLKE